MDPEPSAAPGPPLAGLGYLGERRQCYVHSQASIGSAFSQPSHESNSSNCLVKTFFIIIKTFFISTRPDECGLFLL